MGVIRKKLKTNKVARAGIGYTLGSYFLKGIGFITVPIFSRLLTTQDFGIYNTFLAYEGMLYLFVGLAIHSSIKNAKYEYGDGVIDDYTSSITLIPIFNLFLLLAVVNIAYLIGFRFLSIDTFQLNLLLIYSFCSSLLYIYRARMILDYRTKEYLNLSYFNAISSILFSLLFVLVVYPDKRYLGRILGTVIPMILVALCIVIKLFRKARPKFNRDFWRFGLKISIPIIPHGVGQIVLSSFDRIMITNLIGAAEAGLYSFAYTIYSIIFIAGNSISTVFEPWAFEKLNTNERTAMKERSDQIVCGLALICTITMLIAPELVISLGSEKYRASIPAVMPILLGGFFSMAYTIPAVVEYYYKKTKFIATGTIAAAIINVILNAICIPRFGYIAAAYTTLVSYFLYFLFHLFIARSLTGFFLISGKATLLSSAILMIGITAMQLMETTILVRYCILGILIVSCAIYILKQMKKYKRK